MFAGYLFILIAAVFWGGSGVLAKHMFKGGLYDPVLISQTRVTFAWLFLLGYAFVLARPKLRVNPRDLWRFTLLGVLGVAGSNYCLYDAISRMDAAVADVIQFTAPVIVALWMWARGFEPMDKPKAVALVLSMSGVVLALGVFERHARVTGMGAAMAGASAIAYSFLIVWGKHLSRQYSRLTMLHYGFLAASVFWFFVNPPWRLAPRLADPSVLGMTVVMSLTSVVVPYSCFFAGLKRVSASRAGIVSTFEPVFIAICAWALLGENLLPIQLAGIALVLSAIVIVEAYPRGRGRA